jgi:hypothetical protein
LGRAYGISQEKGEAMAHKEVEFEFLGEGYFA